MSSANSSAVTIKANGTEREVAQGTTVVDLLNHMDVDPQQSGVAVAVDGAVVSRPDWSDTILQRGAEVEVITATQGG